MRATLLTRFSHHSKVLLAAGIAYASAFSATPALNGIRVKSVVRPRCPHPRSCMHAPPVLISTPGSAVCRKNTGQEPAGLQLGGGPETCGEVQGAVGARP